MNNLTEFARALLTKEEIQHYYPPLRNVSKVSSNGKNHHVRSLREEKGLKQSELADKIGCTIKFLQRMENKHWKKLTVEEVEFLAQGFDASSEELLSHFKFNSIMAAGNRMRPSPKDPFFTSEISEGVHIEAYVRQMDEFFIGSLIFSAQKTLPNNRVPKADFIFYGVLKGELLLTLPEKKYVLKAGSRFSLDGGMPYELYK